jgi:ADP-ribose pyrophosphatase
MWEVVESSSVADYEVFRVRRQRARSPRNGEVFTYYVVVPDASVIIVPLTADGRVVLVEQFRQGVRAPMLEFPAGMLDGDEDPVTAALRELEEETGYCAGSALAIGTFHTDPALQDATVTVVVAHDCAPDGRKNEDEGEDVHARLCGADEIGGMIGHGEIRSAPALAAWTLYERWLAAR